MGIDRPDSLDIHSCVVLYSITNCHAYKHCCVRACKLATVLAVWLDVVNYNEQYDICNYIDN
jgi:hypothetical protein